LSEHVRKRSTNHGKKVPSALTQLPNSGNCERRRLSSTPMDFLNEGDGQFLNEGAHEVAASSVSSPASSFSISKRLSLKILSMSFG